jgi:hypothetical protein
MTLLVKDASGATQTIKTNDDMAGVAGTPNANVLSVQGISGGVSLPVAISNLPATQTVTGTVTVSNLPATQPISGSVIVTAAPGLTEGQLRATPVPVSVAFPATQQISGAVSVANFPATQAISAATLPLPAGAATESSLGTLGATPPALPGGATGIMGLLRWIGTLFASLSPTASGAAYRVVLVDPTTGNGSLVQAFHNADNQTVGTTSYGLMTGGVDQLVNAIGNLDRKRAASGDGMAVTGLAAEVPMFWNGSTYDRAPNGPGLAAKAQRVVVATDQSALPVYRAAASYIDRSGSVTAGGASQLLAASNAARRGYRIMNLSSNDLWINDKGSPATLSQPAFKVSAGALYESPHFGVSTAAISILGATTGQAFEAMEA